MMVVGGDDYPGDPGRSVEIFDLEQNIWKEGPQLPEHLDGSPGVAEVGGDQGATAWKVEQGVLKKPRGIFPFARVPFNITEC